MKDKLERRAVKVEFRVEEKDGKTTFIGTPIVYNKRSNYLGFYETISPGAATEALTRSDVVLTYGHNTDTLIPLARLGKSMRAVEDENGVHIEAEAPDTQFARDLATAIKRGDVQDMSFAFTVKEEDEVWERDGEHNHRTISKFNGLYDFSYVATGAYSDTTAAVRSLERFKTSATAGTFDATVENEDIDIELTLNQYED